MFVKKNSYKWVEWNKRHDGNNLDEANSKKVIMESVVWGQNENVTKVSM